MENSTENEMGVVRSAKAKSSLLRTGESGAECDEFIQRIGRLTHEVPLCRIPVFT